MNCFLVFLSLTQTQYAAEMLRASGLTVSIIRPPLSLGGGSCSYAVSLKRTQLPKASSVLGHCGVHPLIYEACADGQFREVRK